APCSGLTASPLRCQVVLATACLEDCSPYHSCHLRQSSASLRPEVALPPFPAACSVPARRLHPATDGSAAPLRGMPPPTAWGCRPACARGAARACSHHNPERPLLSSARRGDPDGSAEIADPNRPARATVS